MNLPILRLNLVVAALILATALPARAQFRVPPGSQYDPSLQTQGYAPPAATPGYYAPPPGNPYGVANQTRVNGALTGVADLTTATGQYYQQITQAQLQQEDLKRSMMDTRKSVYEEMDYEQQKFRSMQQRKEKQSDADTLRAARVNPHPTAIWSGDVLNVLLANIENTQTNYGIQGASVPVDTAALPYINVTSGTTFGSVGLFRDGRPLDWPLALQDDRFQAAREKIESLSSQAVKALVGGKPAGKEIRDLLTAIGELKDLVVAATNDQSPSDNIRSMRYVTQLREGAQTLADPSAKNYLSGRWSAKGSTVPELVANLSMNGLRFAPATEGGEPYYTSVYRSLLNYDASLMRLIGPR